MHCISTGICIKKKQSKEQKVHIMPVVQNMPNVNLNTAKKQL